MLLHAQAPISAGTCRVARSHASRGTAVVVRAAADAQQAQIDRRNAIGALGLIFAGGLIAPGASKAAAGGDAQQVGNYLPADGDTGLFRFAPTRDRTPALRAGVINPDDSYSYSLPGGFKEQRISNTLNGNFCMPRCAEPWFEEVYEDAQVGKVKVLALPLLKLTNAKSATMDKLGAPTALLPRIGPYVTGSYFDEEMLVDASQKTVDGTLYYFYELYGLDITNGPHNLACVTTKGEVVYAFLVTATDKQWKSSEQVLRKTVASFRV